MVEIDLGKGGLMSKIPQPVRDKMITMLLGRFDTIYLIKFFQTVNDSERIEIYLKHLLKNVDVQFLKDNDLHIVRGDDDYTHMNGGMGGVSYLMDVGSRWTTGTAMPDTASKGKGRKRHFWEPKPL
ncbi:MAG: hypothetical protein MPK62_01785 [Alphaproteobacteria bacterium]|nr:hypothetical protein [Alphaproteobacteria bacterium]MDA8029864.1 hypothetical protein [Alphaproteobacteria bacterium]